MVTSTSRAIVQTAPRTPELRKLPLPEIGPDDALLQIEACGICGSDYEQYSISVRAEPVEAPVRFPDETSK
jgi:threonine dehydrogenase-like Zn-dependent dehydrogenase